MLAAAALLLQGCVSLQRRGSAPPEPVGDDVFVGDDVALEEQSPAPEVPPPPETLLGSFVLEVRDQNDKTTPGIIVVVTGPDSFAAESDANGVVAFDGPPGVYEFHVQLGCTDRIQVLQGGSGRGGIAQGQTGRGALSIRWQHRIAPSQPVFADVIPNWPIGRVVTLRYDVRDRCVQNRAPNAPYPTFRFVPSPNLELAESPKLMADADGYGTLKLRCTEEGPIVLKSKDGRNPSDETDLTSIESNSGVRPSCRGE